MVVVVVFGFAASVAVGDIGLLAAAVVVLAAVVSTADCCGSCDFIGNSGRSEHCCTCCCCGLASQLRTRKIEKSSGFLAYYPTRDVKPHVFEKCLTL